MSVCARLSFALFGSSLSVSSIYDGWPELIVTVSRGSLAAIIINKMGRVNACYIRFICPDSIVVCMWSPFQVTKNGSCDSCEKVGTVS